MSRNRQQAGGACVRLLLLAACASAPALRAQCATQWQGTGLPGTNGPVFSTATWDPDGSGPLPPLLILGGNFQIAGNVGVNSIAGYDPSTRQWSSLGTGLN